QRPEPPPLVQVHGRRSGAELHDGRRADRLRDDCSADVLHRSPEPPLLNADRIEDYLMLRLLRSAESALVTGATALALLATRACNAKDELLAPQQPGVISPGNVQSPIAAEGLYNGAVGQFKQGLLGGNGNQETIWQFTGLFTDEYRSSDTFSQRN